MEENVALDSSKQKKFVKSIKGIKKLIKKNEEQNKAPVEQPSSGTEIKKDANKFKKRKSSRGLVYLSHIPHGFYEHQMTQYFKQFGMVTNVRVIRSKRTGRSKGFAFVEFKEPTVAQIVAETMNNYLMGKRLIKALYIPPEKQRRAMRKHWNTVNNPGSNLRMKIKKNFNADKDEKGEMKRAKKLLSNLNKTKKRLKEMGVDYDFFMPVDIPEVLLKNIVKTEKVEDTNEVKDEAKPKKNKKAKTEETKVDLNEKEGKTSKASKLIKAEVNKKDNSKVNDKNKKVEEKQQIIKQQNLKEAPEVNKKQQKQKENQLTKSGIKHMGDFIKVGQDSDNDSDSSLGFDSDEYEKMMSSNEEFDSEDDQSDNCEDGDVQSESEEEDSTSLPAVKKVKQKTIQNKQETMKQPETKNQKKRKNKRANKQENLKVNKTETKPLQLNIMKNEQHNNKQDKTKKRKVAQDTPESSKMLKFEKKHNQKQIRKLNKVKK